MHYDVKTHEDKKLSNMNVIRRSLEYPFMYCCARHRRLNVSYLSMHPGVDFQNVDLQRYMKYNTRHSKNLSCNVLLSEIKRFKTVEIIVLYKL